MTEVNLSKLTKAQLIDKITDLNVENAKLCFINVEKEKEEKANTEWLEKSLSLKSKDFETLQNNFVLAEIENKKELEMLKEKCRYYRGMSLVMAALAIAASILYAIK